MNTLGCFFLKTILLCFPVLSLFSQDSYSFHGVHFLASYLGCDEKALSDFQQLSLKMHEAAKASGATILNDAEHVFPPHSLTLVLLLSESHASIHTYPEHGACFVDLFTCGTQCSSEKFDTVLREYLKPTHVESRVLVRNETCLDILR